MSTASPSSPDAANLVAHVRDRILADLAETARWYLGAMPAFYFKTTTADERDRHLELLHAVRRAVARGDGDPLSLTDDGAAGKLLVIGRPERHRLLDVIRMIRATPGMAAKPIHRVELTTTRDRSLFLWAFCYGPGTMPEHIDLAAHRRAIIADVCDRDLKCEMKAKRYLDAVDQGYLARSNVHRITRHIRAWSRLEVAEDVVVMADVSAEDPTSVRLTLATGDLGPWDALTQLARVLARHPLALTRGYLDLVPAVEGDVQAIVTTAYLATAGQGAKATLSRPSDHQAAELAGDLAAVHRAWDDRRAARWLDGTYSHDELDLLQALISGAGLLLGLDQPFLDVDDTAAEVLADQSDLCRRLCHLVAARFRPGATVAPAEWERLDRELTSALHAVEPRSQAAMLEAMHAVAAAVRLTNAFRPGRLGTALKLDPAWLPATRFPHRPFGIILFSGPHARGLHIRFRPSARGGLRLVIPANPGQYVRGRDRQLQEVYDLAWAQQLKNKDIPEGGAKCIALVEPGRDADAAVKQIADSLIDLLLPTELAPEVVGPFGGAHESALIFLGPDENMTPARIQWIAERARRRQLPNYATLISSKPDAGINHKEFGVTSEGLFTWISEVLPIVGIGLDQPYTVKMTGGPDGDVAGNLLRILHREHGTRARVVAIADGGGAAYDPSGLDWDELLRLVRAGKGIAAFDPAKLAGSGAWVAPASDKRGEERRNRLHLDVVADLFMPCGGRPWTIDDRAWPQFLTDKGKPSAKAMVEGANIFITDAARAALEDRGLVVIRDSSANKGGVICSSYEVLAGLVLGDDEFRSLKPRYVHDVIELIRSHAQAEAKALLSGWKRRNRQVRLSELSAQLSEEINRVSGLLEPVIAGHLDADELRDTWRQHLEAHCPHVLVERARERLAKAIPRPHRVAILAKRLASRMVYKEGLTWCRTYIHEEHLWNTVATYLHAETQVQAVCFHLAAANLPGGEELIRVIAAGAQRELVRRKLGQEY